jgi:hypothetical protein
MVATGLGVLALSTLAAADVDDIASFVDAPRTFNDFPDSNLFFESNFAAGTLSIIENDYGQGGFANRHIAWWGDAANTKVDFDYDDDFKASMVLTVKQADSVGNVEAGFQADLFGFGLFGVLTASGEIAAFGSVLPFHSFGTGLYDVGDELALEMIHHSGAGENMMPFSTMEYRYNNLTQNTGWISSGEIDFTTTEGGIPSAFDAFFGAGAQINQPDPQLGAVDIQFNKIQIVPAPGTLALAGCAGLVALRRRR